MSDLSNTFEQRVFDWLFRPGESVTRPTAIYLALFTAVSNAEAGTGTEVSGGSYARVNITSLIGAPTDGVGSNSGAITFPSPTANWGTVTHFAVMDASTGGNAVSAIKALAASRVINNGDAAPSFPIGDLDLSVA
ncbi:phage tail fiber protein [Gemmatimonas sp.]